MRSSIATSRYLAAGILTVATTVAAQANKPHIVFILVDDWGWSNVGYHRGGNHPEWQTPNIGACAWKHTSQARLSTKRAPSAERP